MQQNYRHLLLFFFFFYYSLYSYLSKPGAYFPAHSLVTDSGVLCYSGFKEQNTEVW